MKEKRYDQLATKASGEAMKSVQPISIRFTAEERDYLRRLAEVQGDGKISRVIRRMVRREMYG